MKIFAEFHYVIDMSAIHALENQQRIAKPHQMMIQQINGTCVAGFALK